MTGKPLDQSSAFPGWVFLLIASFSVLVFTTAKAETPETVSVFFDPALGSSFFDFPWPSDLRVDDAGHPIMDGFPNPENVELLSLYLDTIEKDLVGFGTNAPIYFRFSGDIQIDRLPLVSGDTLESSSPLFIVDIDPQSATRFERVPAHARYTSEETMYAPSNLLAIAPDWGFPLRPATTYAAVVLRSLGAADGSLLEAPADLRALLAGDPPADSALEPIQEDFALLRAYLDAAGIPTEDVAAASIFTTQDPVGELDVIRSFMRTTFDTPMLDPTLEKPLWFVPETRDYEKVHEQEEFLYPDTPSQTELNAPKPWYQFEGYYQGPNFQEGDPPYADEGGAIRFDESGRPIVQRWEPLRFCLVVPRGEPPPQGWPIAIFAHGTGGSYKDLLYGSYHKIAEMLVSKGVAVIGIDEPLHGERAPAGTDPEILSFNFMNPDAARGNFRQAAIDVMYLVWLIQSSLEIPADVSPTGEVIGFDPDAITFIGHSHGGLAGSLLVPYEEDLQASVLSGSGGGLSLTILLRKDYVDFEDLFRTLLLMPDDEPLDEFHSVMALVQILVEITDPLNYSPFFILDPPGGRARNVLMTEGFKDEATPPKTAEAEAVAGGLPIITPLGRTLYGLELRGIDPLPMPAADNVQGPDGVFATAALAQFPEDNHYAIFRNYDAASLYAEFLSSASYSGDATLVFPE